MKIRESVTAVFKFGEEVFAIKRQNYLKVFPGYTAFPGGKVDKDESDDAIDQTAFEGHPNVLMNALCREIQEELNFDLISYSLKNNDIRISQIGTALTPEFNPYRFNTHFFLIEINERINFEVDKEEASQGKWQTPQIWLKDYEDNLIMAVPPTIKVFKELAKNEEISPDLILGLTHNPEKQVPMIESIYGVKQFLPLSNTFPPANRTNCFLIGKVLIDPSPKDGNEYKKLKESLRKYTINEIFLTHHHPDHHEHSVQLAQDLNIPMSMSQDTYNRILAKWGKDYFKSIEIKMNKEGDVLTISNSKEILLYSIPGHDEGQLGLAPATMEWFLVGDLIQTVGTVVIGAPEGDMQKYFNSLEKVIGYNPKFIIPSHGISTGSVLRLKQTLDHRKEREEQIKSLLEEGKSEEDMLSIIYSGLNENLHKYALKTIKSHIKKIKGL